MSRKLSSLKGLYKGFYRGLLEGASKEDTRSLDYSPHRPNNCTFRTLGVLGCAMFPPCAIKLEAFDSRASRGLNLQRFTVYRPKA